MLNLYIGIFGLALTNITAILIFPDTKKPSLLFIIFIALAVYSYLITSGINSVIQDAIKT